MSNWLAHACTMSNQKYVPGGCASGSFLCFFLIRSFWRHGLPLPLVKMLPTIPVFIPVLVGKVTFRCAKILCRSSLDLFLQNWGLNFRVRGIEEEFIANCQRRSRKNSQAEDWKILRKSHFTKEMWNFLSKLLRISLVNSYAKFIPNSFQNFALYR